MDATLVTGGGRLAITCAIPWVCERIREGADSQLETGSTKPSTMRVVVEDDRSPFNTRNWTPITRDAWARDGRVVIRDVATSGFDVLALVHTGVPTFTFRWRPPTRTRAAAHVLRTRARLLVRSVLLQFPPIWSAGLDGLAPLHASAVSVGSVGTALLTGASGAGKTTLVQTELGNDGRTVGDNLTVTDGQDVWGVVEPVRSMSGHGRRATHGRHESHLPGRVASLTPSLIVVVRRGACTRARRGSPELAARALVASTYSAGELRRYWPIHALLAMGTGLGPAHPAVLARAETLGARLPCVDIELADPGGTRLTDILTDHEMLQWN